MVEHQMQSILNSFELEDGAINLFLIWLGVGIRLGLVSYVHSIHKVRRESVLDVADPLFGFYLLY